MNQAQWKSCDRFVRWQTYRQNKQNHRNKGLNITYIYIYTKVTMLNFKIIIKSSTIHFHDVRWWKKNLFVTIPNEKSLGWGRVYDEQSWKIHMTRTRSSLYEYQFYSLMLFTIWKMLNYHSFGGLFWTGLSMIFHVLFVMNEPKDGFLTFPPI